MALDGPNCAVVRDLWKGFLACDFAACAPLLAEHVVWRSAMTGEGAGVVYEGHEGWRRYLDDMADAWSERAGDITELTDRGDGHVAFEAVLRVRGSSSGVELSQPLFGFLIVANEKVTLAQFYRSREEARAELTRSKVP